MHWRTLLISKPCKLSLHNRQLLLEGEDRLQLPIEDINAVVLETPQAIITTALLSALAAHSVVVLTCDEQHLPNGALMPFMPHSRQLQVLHRQVSASVPLQKRLWQMIVQVKVRNQALGLDSAHAEGGDYLRALAESVQSGDGGNVEGVAAQFYFPALFGDGFTRGMPIWQNGALNYGFAVIRGCLARSLASYGFITALGLHHCNELNPFNLADDLIEPFRPLVEQVVFRQNFPNPSSGLTPNDKKNLVGILYQDVFMPVVQAGQANADKKANQRMEKMNVLAAIDRVVVSLSRALEQGEPKALHLPTLIIPPAT